MINLDFSTVIILMLVAFIIGLIIGASFTRPAYQTWIEPKQPKRESLVQKGEAQDEESRESSSLELSGDSTTNAPSPISPRIASIIHCSTCNFPNPPESTFCMKCGTQLERDSSTKTSPPYSAEESDFIYCPQCGSPNPSRAKFCKSCGTLLPGDSTTDAPPPKKKKPKGDEV